MTIDVPDGAKMAEPAHRIGVLGAGSWGTALAALARAPGARRLSVGARAGSRAADPGGRREPVLPARRGTSARTERNRRDGRGPVAGAEIVMSVRSRAVRRDRRGTRRALPGVRRRGGVGLQGHRDRDAAAHGRGDVRAAHAATGRAPDRALGSQLRGGSGARPAHRGRRGEPVGGGPPAGPDRPSGPPVFACTPTTTWSGSSSAAPSRT